MPFNGAGDFTKATSDVVAGTVISSSNYNTQNTDFANGLSGVICKDGQTTITNNLPMANFRHTGVGNAAARTDYAAAGQVQDGALTWCGTAGGTKNALTLTPTPAISAYATGQRFAFKAGSTQSDDAVTIAISGLATKAAQINDAALSATVYIEANKYYEALYDGTALQLTKMSSAAVVAASETVAGIIEIATAAETTTGTDDARALTPLKLTTFAPAAATFAPGADSLIFRDGSDSDKLKRGPIPAGFAIDHAYTSTTTRSSCTTVIAADGSIPQISEGDQILSVAITPKATTNRIRAEVTVPCYVDGLTCVCALFVAGTNDALAVDYKFITATGSPAEADNFVIGFEHSPGSTSAQTYSVRVGVASGTLYVNGNASTQPYGAKQTASLRLTEIVAS